MVHTMILITIPFSGYIAECHYIDGSQLDASSFGETDDSGIWKAIQYTGSYGTGWLLFRL